MDVNSQFRIGYQVNTLSFDHRLNLVGDIILLQLVLRNLEEDEEKQTIRKTKTKRKTKLYTKTPHACWLVLPPKLSF